MAELLPPTAEDFLFSCFLGSLRRIRLTSFQGLLRLALLAAPQLSQSVSQYRTRTAFLYPSILDLRPRPRSTSLISSYLISHPPLRLPTRLQHTKHPPTPTTPRTFSYCTLDRPSPSSRRTQTRHPQTPESSSSPLSSHLPTEKLPTRDIGSIFSS